METMELYQFGESFDSPMRNLSESSSLPCDAFGGSMGLFDFDCNEYKMDNFNDQCSSNSSSDDEEIIDIEAIDELGSIMQSPDRSATFSSARTAPIDTLARRKSVPTVAEADPGSTKPEEVVFKQPTITLQPADGTERVRHNSEQIVEDLVALHDKLFSSAATNSDTSQLQLTPSIDHIRFDGSMEDDDQFSLLGIEGIQADDLESLIKMFEGAIESPVKAKLLSPSLQLSLPASRVPALIPKLPSPAPVAKPKPRLSLDDYRKLRGIKPPTSHEAANAEKLPVTGTRPPVTAARAIRFANGFPFAKEPLHDTHTSTQVLSNNPSMIDHAKPQGVYDTQNMQQKPQNEGRLKQPGRKQLSSKTKSVTNMSKLGEKVQQSIPTTTLPKEFSLVIPVTEAASTQSRGVRLKALEPSVEQNLHNVTHDHNYLNSSPSPAPAPALSRDIRKELELLLKKIPEYLAAAGNSDISSTQSSQPSIAYTKIISIKQEPTINCSYESKPKTSAISLESSAVKAPFHRVTHAPTVKVEAEERPLGLPKAYVLPDRERPRKRRYRRRHTASSSRSSSRSSCSSSSSSCSECSGSDSGRNRGNVGVDSDADSCSSCDSCHSSRSQSRYRRRMSSSSSYSRKTKRKINRTSRSSKISSRSQSRRAGRHKAPSSNIKRRRYKRSRSSQSVSPYTSTTSAISRSPSPRHSDLVVRRRREAQEAHNRAMAERRVVYVGGISDRYTRADLRKRFGGFGEIENVLTRLRDKAENYGFVTFYSKADAYAAVEKGNDVYGPKFNLGFGGRRTFCDTEYADLDGCQAVKEEWAPSLRLSQGGAEDFDTLLQNSMKKIKT